MSATIAVILGVTSGLALLVPHLNSASMIATAIIVDLSLAPVTAILAYQHKRSATAWTLLGLAFGAWALAAILIVTRVASPQAGEQILRLLRPRSGK